MKYNNLISVNENFQYSVNLQFDINNTIFSFTLIYKWVHKTKAQLTFIVTSRFITFSIETIQTIHCCHVFFLSGTCFVPLFSFHIINIARDFVVVNSPRSIK